MYVISPIFLAAQIQVRHLREVWESFFSEWESGTFLPVIWQIDKGSDFSGWESTFVNSLVHEFLPIFLTKIQVEMFGSQFSVDGNL